MLGVSSKTVFAAAIVLLCAGIVPSQAGNYDGHWTVRVITEKGGCDASSSYDVNVANGHIVYSGLTSVSMSGTISPKGEVLVSLRHHDDTASGHGHLSELKGEGSWRGAGKFSQCSGHWEANRR